MFQTQLRAAAKACLLIGIFLVVHIAVLYAAPAPAPSTAPPNAGNILQNNQTTAPPPPTAPQSNMTINNSTATTPVAPGGPTVTVSRFVLFGQTEVSDSVLLNIIQPYVGQSLTLAQLQGAAGDITKFLRKRGYMVARAYIPQQTVVGGRVDIEIVIGRYGNITVLNHSSESTRYINSIVSAIQTGDVIHQYTLERTMLLLTDISGASVRGTLSAGQHSGQSDLLIEVNNAKKVDGRLTGDNWGDGYTGQYRGTIQLLINDVTGNADSLNVGELYAGSGMDDYNAGYTIATGSQGAKFSMSYSRLNYKLGGVYSDLDATGIADVTSLDESYPFIRSRELNVTGDAGVDAKILKDTIGAEDNVSEKRDGVFHIGATGDFIDPNGSGSTNFTFTLSQGTLSLHSPDAIADDTLHTAGLWNKEDLNIVRQQSLGPHVSYYINFSSQVAEKNLDSSEQFVLGGATGVRAYPQGEATGDEGWLATGEVHIDLPTPALQLAPFIDMGTVRLAKSPLTESGDNVHLAGGGLGIIANCPNDLAARLDYALKITSYRATSDTDHNGRIWFTVSQGF
jgi:hemolysin activation/secretion protein